MRYIPFEDFEIHSTLSSSEIFYRLRASVETKETWRILIKKPYFGRVNRNNFRIKKVTKWWDRSLPSTISGEILPRDPGSCIRIIVKSHWYIIMFYTIWLAACWYLLFSEITILVIYKIQTGIWHIALSELFWPVGMFIFGYLILEIDFMIDTKRSKEFLMKLLETDMETIKHKDVIFGLTEFQIILLLFLGTAIISILSIVINLFL